MDGSNSLDTLRAASANIVVSISSDPLCLSVGSWDFCVFLCFGFFFEFCRLIELIGCCRSDSSKEPLNYIY